MPKQDPKLLSSKQKYEPARVARRYRIPVSVVRETALEVGKDGKPSRSLKNIYAALEAKGYKKGGLKSPLNENLGDSGVEWQAETFPPEIQSDKYVNG